MVDSLPRLWLLLLPIVIAGCLHMVIVTRNILPGLAVPLYERGFGRNKTWRGFLCVPAISSLVAPLCLNSVLGDTAISLQVGMASGLGYMLAELPNSALKRYLRIPPGTLPSRHKGAFIFLDQADSALGVAIGCRLVLPLNLLQMFTLMGLFMISAVIIKNMLYLLALKKSRF